MRGADSFGFRTSRRTHESAITSTDEFSSLPEVVDGDDWRRSKTEKEVAGADGAETTRRPPRRDSAGADGKQMIWRDSQKEVAGADGIERPEELTYGLPFTPPTHEDDSSDEKAVAPVKSRKPTRWICTVVALLILLGIGLGVGLGIGLKPSQSDSKSKYASNGTAGSVDTGGVLNGTGIGVCRADVPTVNLTSGESESPQLDSNLFLFFQHSSGEIRWMQRIVSTWTGGQASDVVATDAKMGTPISVLSEANRTGEWHVFYIGNDNMYKQRRLDNLTYVWSDGLLNQMNIKALDNGQVGLQSCFYEGPIDNVDLNGTVKETGIRLFLATSETTFDQVAWRYGLPHWEWEQSWENLNGHANPACFGWDVGTTTYVMFLDLQNAVNLYWKDTSTKLVSTDSHPINTWTKSSIIISNIDPTAGLAFRGDLYAKMADTGDIRGWNISFAAENTSIVPSMLSTPGGSPGAPGTSLEVYTNPPTGPVEDIALFYQTEGNDITQYYGSTASGNWNKTMLPIPND